MTCNVLIGILCALIAGMIFLSLLHDIILWAYKEGYARGRREADSAWMEAGRQVDQARQEIWKEEARG